MVDFSQVAPQAESPARQMPNLSPREHIDRIASRKIQGFLGTIDADGEYFDSVHKQNQSLSEHVIADYHGRFLIELIQNGHDAHDKAKADGEISVLLASDENEHGTLYVANRGQPFQSRNVDALCEMGLSSKPPGEAVGNKGLGFRSVRHVTDRPQIFSRCAEKRTGGPLDGYQFTFLQGEALDPLLPTAATLKMAKADLPAFYIPGWVEEVPTAVAELAERGFSTIIRLPIRNAEGLRDVADEMRRLATAEAPMLLFLRRIQKLEVRLSGSRLAEEVFELTLRRHETSLGGATDLTLVDLKESGRFWVARAEIPEADMQAAVAHGLKSGALPQSWKGWAGPGEVALAAPVDDDRSEFKARLYTFLPMGQGAGSPFRGHLHGSFFPSSNRKSLDPTVRVNALVLERAVALATEAAHRLTGPASQGKIPNVSSTMATRVAMDFLLWETPSSLAPPEQAAKTPKVDLGADMAAAIARQWSVDSAGEAAFVPCLGVWTGDPLAQPEFGPVQWRLPSVARRIGTEAATFSLEVVARFGERVGVAPYWPGLGIRQTDALAQFLNDFGDGYDTLSVHERAAIVEGLAQSLAKAKRPDWKGWRAFYSDLPVFMSNMDGPLAGRAILFCQDGSLRAARDASPAETTGGTPKRRRRQAQAVIVFFPPGRGDAEEGIGEEFYPPVPLREFFAFLHDELPWYGALAAARQFLERSVAQPFESEALLSRISQIVERDETKKVRFAGLRWAFAIWRRSVAIKRPIALSPSYRLFVPNLEGDLIRATDAVFSAAWPSRTLGSRLQQFLELAPQDIDDLAEVRRRRLALPSHTIFGSRNVDAWTTFLSGIGLQSGLQPRAVGLEGYVSAYQLTSLAVFTTLKLPEGLANQVKTDVATRPSITLDLPVSTNYQIADPIWWLPGQASVGSFSDDALDAYAALIGEWIGKVERRQLWMTVRHQHNFRADAREWPTPLAAFLRSVAWVPCEEHGPDGSRRLRVRGAEVWLAPSHDRYPPFLRRPSYRFARALDQAPDGAIAALRQHAEFKTFNSAETLPEQADFLADQFAEGCVRRYYERELVNIYNRVWSRLADQYGSPDAPALVRPPPNRLLVRRRGVLDLATVTGEGAEAVYIRDNADSVAAGLIDVVGDPILDIRTLDPSRIGAVAERFYGDRARRTSTLSYGVNIGGHPLDKVPLGPRLVDRCPWLRPMLAVALEALDSIDMNRLPADRSSIVQTLDRIEVQLDSQVSFSFEERDVTPASLRPAYAFQRAAGQPLLIMVGAGELTWSGLEASLPAIGELIQHVAIVPHMKLLARQLSVDGVPIDDRPVGQADLMRLCHALNLSDHASEAARDSLGERLDRQLPWFRAVVHQLGGEVALDIWASGELGATESRAGLVNLLNTCLPDARVGADEIVEAVKTSLSPAELRDRLGFDFADFNISLKASGSAPDVDPQGQASQLAFYVQDHFLAICDALRNMVAPTVLKFEPDQRYATARESLANLLPDPAWAPIFQRIPEEQLASHIAAWLGSIGAPPVGLNPHGLNDVATVRAANATQLRQTAKAAQPLVRAWGVLKAASTHNVWQDPVAMEGELRRRLDDAAAFDCRAWTETELLTWFLRLGVWPGEMQLTLDRNVLGVAETEVEAQAQKAEADRARRDREARSVRLNGVWRDPLEADWLALSQEIASGLPKSVLNRPIGTFTPLAPAGSRRSRGAGSGSSASGGAYKGVPQDKKDMIGRLGELAVYHWLKARQPEQDIDACWVSGNAALFNGREGDDTLGYDFRIPFNKQTWFIEVKASTEDPCHFEMGETEVRKAREVARSRAAERYVIAYVANVVQTGQTMIELLPNPLGADADGALWIAGDSIRYGFKRGS